MNIQPLQAAAMTVTHQRRVAPTIGSETDWRDEAACLEVHADEFYPEGKGASTAAAKQVCAGCPVTTECLTFALVNRESHGVWGGLSARERRSLARRRAAA